MVYDEPTAKGRPRVVVQNGRARAYTPSKTQQAEWRIRQAWIAEHGTAPTSYPIHLTVRAYVSMPKSIPKRDRLTALPTKRPDLDNYVKTVADALDCVAWGDDAQVVVLTASKHYAVDGPPRWEIEVEPA